MRILAVDDEFNQLKLLEHAVECAVPGCELSAFQNPAEALTWAQTHSPEIAFLDIQMPVMTGIELGKALKRINPQINLIFVTGYYQEYVIDAVPLYFSGYLQKPVTEADIAKEMEHLRFPLPQPTAQKPLTVRCFGNFEVFHDGKAVQFSRSKTKELLAFLVDRKGARVNGNEICAAIYRSARNESGNKSDLRKCVADLRATLRSLGIENVFLKGFDSYAVDTSLLACDYYDWENDAVYAVRSFRGEYMSQYSWAEETLAGLLYKR